MLSSSGSQKDAITQGLNFHGNANLTTHYVGNEREMYIKLLPRFNKEKLKQLRWSTKENFYCSVDGFTHRNLKVKKIFLSLHG
jgi:hypothetical protein